MKDEDSINKDIIEKLRTMGLTTDLMDVKKQVIDTLESFGESAIPTITEIIDDTEHIEVKEYGLEKIKRIKERPGFVVF